MPPNLVKSRSLEIGCHDNHIALKFGMHLNSGAAEVPVNFQSDRISLNPNLAASRLRKILRVRRPTTGWMEALISTVGVISYGLLGINALQLLRAGRGHGKPFVNYQDSCGWAVIGSSSARANVMHISEAFGPIANTGMLYRQVSVCVRLPCFIEAHIALPVTLFALKWRHNEPDGVSNHQAHDCLLNRYSGADQRKNETSASLAFVRGIHRWPVNSPHKGPVTRKRFQFEDVIMVVNLLAEAWLSQYLKYGNHIVDCEFERIIMKGLAKFHKH